MFHYGHISKHIYRKIVETDFSVNIIIARTLRKEARVKTSGHINENYKFYEVKLKGTLTFRRKGIIRAVYPSLKTNRILRHRVPLYETRKIDIKINVESFDERKCLYP